MSPHCGALEAYDARRPNGSLRFRDFTLTAGTLFASHKLPLKLSLCPSAYDIYCSVPVPSFVSPQQLPLPTIPRIAVRSPLISRPAVRLNIDQDWLASIVGTCRAGIDEFRIHGFWLRHLHPLNHPPPALHMLITGFHRDHHGGKLVLPCRFFGFTTALTAAAPATGFVKRANGEFSAPVRRYRWWRTAARMTAASLTLPLSLRLCRSE
jgi:hypothetical protein